MLFRKAAIVRNFGIGILFVLGIVACERDLEDIAVDLAGQRPFDVGDTIIEVVAYNISRDSSRVDNNNPNKIPLYLLGVNRDNDFGLLKSDLVTQLSLPFNGANFGENPVIDEVVVTIPYFATRDGDQNAVDPDTGLPILDEAGDTIQVPNFTLDSIYGKKELPYTMRVHELGTYLNVLDPLDPSKPNSYYSNRDYLKNALLHEGDFIPNRNDTVLYVERRNLDGDPNTLDDIDTIKADNVAPSIKFNLDNEFFTERFLEHDNAGDFATDESFARYFRGLFLEADGFDGSLMNLNTNNANMTIYYTNDQILDEEDDEDLNYNGITGETGVLVHTKQARVFPFGGVRAGKYYRDYGGAPVENALLNPDKINGETTLYIQGASGSEAIIDLFSQEEMEALRQEKWLINEANLVFYLDGEQSEVPNQLFLYNYDYGSILFDLYSRIYGPELFGGTLEYDSDGKPEKYKFRITGYISELLHAESPPKVSRLALKNFVSTDLPNFANLDTLIGDWNFIPKGVVLHGNRTPETAKRIKLEIFYSK